MDSSPNPLPPPLPRKYTARTILPPISPSLANTLEPRRIFAETRKQINIRYNPHKPKEVRRAQSMLDAASTNMNWAQYKDSDGIHEHIVFRGSPGDLRMMLGSNDPVVETPDEEAMKRSRKTILASQNQDQDFSVFRAPSRSKPTRTGRNELREELLRKRFVQSLQRNQTRKTKSAMPKRLNL